MSKKWERTYPNNYLKRDLPCSEYKVDSTHSVLVLYRDGNYSFYLMQKNIDETLGTPFLYMFGEPEGQMSYDEMIDMVITVAPDYYFLFEED